MPPTDDHHVIIPPPATPVSPEAAASPRPGLTGGNRVRLLAGGDEQFPAMCAAIAQARHQVWLATYIFHDDAAAQQVVQALADAARRGLWVAVVVDGFGSKATLPKLQQWLEPAGVQLVVFRPVDRWWRLLQPGQLRRLHQKLCVVDGHTGYVGGINLIDDRNDLNHGFSEAPRLDFAVEVQGPLAAAIEQTARAMWSRAALGADWRDELVSLARSAEPVARAKRMVGRLRILPSNKNRKRGPPVADLPPVRAAFLVRDNLRQRRSIEHAYIEAIDSARERVEVMCPYFYPGRVFRRALERAALRGVQVRLLLQGKADYRFAALAAQVLYGELLATGVRIFEYTPAFLHAKVALVDDDWATVGSSNIDPLSLLLNLEANVIVRDLQFAADLALRFEAAVQASREVTQPPIGSGWWGTLRRGFVASTAYWFLRLAGMSGKY
ncbi:cardiolipin synthase ClsB [Aquabacterium sp.]|uniref:cardiolipin synthase ClsB n=1 Tax=Aquabacterium sp. TaxID=1872578 RepID=UPI002D01CDB1|nr:cardiolipin synthase ClsB [Aquabacterium sp.]HSW08553.1 cardiolipin synthase ClsB [Aquabacterium sp.]